MALLVAISRSEMLGVALVTVEVIVVFLMRKLDVRREVRAHSVKHRREFFSGLNETRKVRT